MMTIHIKDLRVPVLVGVYDSERRDAQPVMMNIRIDFDEKRAVATDKVEDTVNYDAMVQTIEARVKNTRFYLLEKLVDHVLGIVMENPRVRRAQVEIDKPDAPIPQIESVSITGSASRI